MTFLDLDPVATAHLLAAVDRHLALLEQRDRPIPASVRQLQQYLRFSLRSGQDRSRHQSDGDFVDDADMSALLLTVPDLVALFKLSEASIRRLIRNGQLPAVKIGGATRVRREDAEAFVAGLTGTRPNSDPTLESAYL